MGASTDSFLSQWNRGVQPQVPFSISGFGFALLFDDNFIANPNITLEHTALPCRQTRSLNDGIRDLERLAVAGPIYRWEEVREGLWAFDPKCQTWYSLGGQLEIPSMNEVLSGMSERIKHLFFHCDLSELGEELFLFHLHHELYERFLAPPKESLAHPELRDIITKFLAATPSGTDYNVIASLWNKSKQQVPTRSFIVHGLGITEFTYPNDVSKLEKMAATSRGIRDQTLLGFDIDGYLQQHGSPVDSFHIVSSFVAALNEKLPDGFSIKTYPTGTNF